MEIIEREYILSIKELLSKLSKLKFTTYEDDKLNSKEKISVRFELKKDIGVNKDKNMLTISTYYMEKEIYVTATLITEEQKYCLDWFYSIMSLIDKNNDKTIKKGMKILKKL